MQNVSPAPLIAAGSAAQTSVYPWFLSFLFAGHDEHDNCIPSGFADHHCFSEVSTNVILVCPLSTMAVIVLAGHEHGLTRKRD